MTRWADLTDDQLGDRLAEDLRSLADGADASADWASRRLLPGVRARLSPRPERVPASRLAPLAAIGAVAGLIVLFALAAPSLGPGGATPSPEQTPPSEWSALNTTDFAQRYAAGELRGQTVVVIGELDGVNYYDQCAFGEPCERYALAGASPPVLVRSAALPALEGQGASAEVEGVDWEWWKWPDDPPDGAALVLSVTSDGLVEYVGYLSEAPFGVGSFALVDPASMSQSEVHVVPGWLTAVGVGLPFSGPAPQQGTFIAGLPQRWSGSPAWLLDRPLRLDPEGFFRPEDGVQLQNGAYEMFADTMPTSRITEPVAGLWAVAPRLEGGGCPDDAPPCWRWNLVGALEVLPPGPAMPVPSLDVTPTAAPVDSPGITPSPGEAPTASPSPMAPAQYCRYADQSGVPDEEVDITFTDHTGLIDGCVGGVAEVATIEGPTEVRWLPDGNRLVATWRRSVCDPSLVEVALWPLRRGGYFLAVDIEGAPRGSCPNLGGQQSVELSLNGWIDPAKVDVRTMSDGRAWAAQESTVGDFSLQVGADRTHYVAGEQIDIDGTVALNGSPSQVGLSGYFHGFSFTQLDGDLAMSTFHTLPCQATTISASEPKRFAAINNMTGLDGDTEFYRTWRESPFLWLPAGTWRVNAYSRFSLGSDCGPEQIDLRVSIVLHVSHPEPADAIALRTAPPNPDGACPGAEGAGYLASHPESGAGIIDWGSNELMQVLWPNGFTASHAGGLIVLYGQDGLPVAREGDFVRFAAAYFDDYVYACQIEEVSEGSAPTP